MNKKVIIIGAGPAGLGTAYSLIEKTDNLDIEIIKKGKDISDRSCCQQVQTCNPCGMLYGVGSAGGFSDGKINLDENIGGRLSKFYDGNIEDLISFVFSEMIIKNSESEIFSVLKNEDKQNDFLQNCLRNGIRFIPLNQYHIGTDNLPTIIRNITSKIKESGIKINTSEEVIDVKHNSNGDKEIITNRRKIIADCVVVNTGRTGNDLVRKICDLNDIAYAEREIDVGVRLEFLNETFNDVFSHSYDPKLIIPLNESEKVRTFCTNPSGFVVVEKYPSYIGVNGHAYSKKKSNNTNLAILYSAKLEGNETGENYRQIAEQIAKDSGFRPILQTLHDLKINKSSTEFGETVPTLKRYYQGNIRDYYSFEIVKGIIQGIEILDKVIPGIASDSSLIYSPEIKYRSVKINLKNDLSTGVEGLYFAGDGSGHAGDIIHSAVMGWLIGEKIKNE
jgi:hypothetical protein